MWGYLELSLEGDVLAAADRLPWPCRLYTYPVGGRLCWEKARAGTCTSWLQVRGNSFLGLKGVLFELCFHNLVFIQLEIFFHMKIITCEFCFHNLVFNPIRQFNFPYENNYLHDLLKFCPSLL